MKCEAIRHGQPHTNKWKISRAYGDAPKDM